jgi:hypothetical protein
MAGLHRCDWEGADVLRRLALRDFVIVPALELDFHAGFSVLTGETGAGKSILIDALQLALGSRGDAGVVREGATRAEITAEFHSPATLAPWLEEAGFQGDDPGILLLRRTVDAQGKSRAWINGSPATVTQLREAADHLVDIHGQHAWQSLTRPAATRALLDSQAGIDTTALVQLFAPARPRPTRCSRRASAVMSCCASVNAWPGRSTSWKSWPRAMASGPSCRPSTSAWPMRRP